MQKQKVELGMHPLRKCEVQNQKQDEDEQNTKSQLLALLLSHYPLGIGTRVFSKL